MYFAANDGQNGLELWRTDGTTSGTFLVKDIDPFKVTFGNFTFAAGSNPSDLTAFNGRLYFQASDRVHGSQLWESDGTVDGTQRRELWGTDGTTAGTAMLADLNPTGDAIRSSYLRPMLADVVGVLLFAADDGTHGQELWRSDGTAAGTTQVADINPGPGDGI